MPRLVTVRQEDQQLTFSFVSTRLKYLIMKTIVLAFLLLLLSFDIIGQTHVETVRLRKTAYPEPATTINLPYAPGVVKQALRDYLIKTKVPHHETDSFLISENMQLLMNQPKDTRIYFAIRQKDDTSPDETIVLLSLDSGVQYGAGDEATSDVLKMHEPGNYVHNFSLSIRTHANALQRRTQQQSLAAAYERNDLLMRKSIELERQRININYEIAANKDLSRNATLTQIQTDNQEKIDHNLVAQLLQNKEVTKQKKAMDKLLLTSNRSHE